ncbi:MAG TPA: hypothetical protein VFO85_03740 [Vicinamibacteria bacterium]|nr:hypothetical protein [Vicinamibacteria bacterium]
MILAAALVGCGGGSSPSAPSQPAPPPAPSAAVTANGAGALVLHPSLDTRFGVAMETPIRVQETAGGSANWSFVRMSLFRRGAEIERAELGANVINAAGFGTINARSNEVYRVLFRFNSDDFDRVDITLGLIDRKDGRAFTAAVPFNTFTDVNVSLTPMSITRSRIPL